MLFGLCQSLNHKQNYFTTQYKVVFRLFEKLSTDGVVPNLESENTGVDYCLGYRGEKRHNLMLFLDLFLL